MPKAIQYVAGLYRLFWNETHGTLNISTTPVNGGIYVDGAYKGIGSWTGSVELGSYTVSFGPVTGYPTPDPQTVTVTAGQTVNVTGTYAASTTRIIRLSGDLAFGSVTVGQTPQRILTIYNDGNTALTVSGISFPTGFTGSWSEGTISAESSQNLTVTFTPTAATSYSGTVTVNSNKTSGRIQYPAQELDYNADSRNTFEHHSPIERQ